MEHATKQDREDGALEVVPSEAMEQLYGDEDAINVWLQQFGGFLNLGIFENNIQEDDIYALDDDQFTKLEEQAHYRAIDELLTFARILTAGDGRRGVLKILDVGSGLGGASRYLARKLAPAFVQGISLGKLEIEKSISITASENLSHLVSFVQGDATEMPFPDNEYDLVWCILMLDHIFDKKKIMKELTRVTACGGQIVLTTICRAPASFENLKDTLKDLSVDGVSTLASWTPSSIYRDLAVENGLEAIKTEDWAKKMIPGLYVEHYFCKKYISKTPNNTMKDLMDYLIGLARNFEHGDAEYFVLCATKPTQ